MTPLKPGDRVRFDKRFLDRLGLHARVALD